MQLDKYKDIGFSKRASCMVCDNKLDQSTISLPKCPLTEVYVEHRVEEELGFADQEFHFCEKCGHGQIANVMDQNILYGNTYKTRTSTSSSAKAAVDAFLEFINASLKNRKVGTILEIGCNDLYTLKKLRNRADVLYGVDPILKGQEDSVEDEKIKVIGDFVENVDVKALGLEIDVVLSSHTLEHVEKPKRLIQNLLDISSSETILFFQFPSLEELVNDAHFDQMFHQHLNYFSLQSVLHMLNEVDAELLEFKVNPYHWGALMIAFRKKRHGSNRNADYKDKAQKMNADLIVSQYDAFKANMDLARQRIDSFGDRNVYGYGAALMLPILEYYLKRIAAFKCVIDEDVSKKDLYYLNVPVQIKMLDQIQDIKDSVVVVTAINSMDAVRGIVKKLIQMNVEKIILPVNLM